MGLALTFTSCIVAPAIDVRSPCPALAARLECATVKVPEIARRSYRAAGFSALTVASVGGVVLDMAVAKDDARRPDIRDRCTSTWANALFKLFDVTMIVGGDAGPPGMRGERGRVVVSNHRSVIDIAVMLALFGGALISRGEIEHWPLIGRAARSAGTIFVDRSSKTSGAKVIRSMTERLQLGDTICLFPEGTTYEGDEVHEFKSGAFVAAKRAKVPVVPVGLVYPHDSGAAYGDETFMQHLGRLAGSTNTKVWVEIGAPMEIDDGERSDAFTDRCRAEVVKLVASGREKEQNARKS
jgi:1-acyl-sn-glycerol-3-phosphate acyltransferase